MRSPTGARADWPRELELEVRDQWTRGQRAYVTVAKPVLDRLLAAVLLILLAPLLLGLALLVRGSLGCPVLFRQERIGRNGEPFTVIKFRSMTPCRRLHHSEHLERDRRLTHKHACDPRLTAIGRSLRRWSLDELPQLLNVLKGEMSLVGPRPELPEIVRRYSPWQHRRHAVRPGLTGLWQTSQRGLTPMHECVDVDVTYVSEIGLVRDLRILAATPVAALGRNRGH